MSGQIILLPHPGGERTPPRKRAGRCPWPRKSSDHQRKWLTSGGTFLDCIDGPAAYDTLGVWCEYEAPTFATPATGKASWLHCIDASELSTASSGNELNTDPWIWYPGFLWSVCRKTRKHERRAVRKLVQGDLVLFGSVLDKKWCLDTVLVVEQRHVPPPNDAAYVRFVKQPLKPLLPRPTKGCPWRLDAETFSFAPVQVGNVSVAPGRVDISSIVTSLVRGNGESPKAWNHQALVACVPSLGATVSDIWNQVASAVIAAGMKLGVCFSYPS